MARIKLRYVGQWFSYYVGRLIYRADRHHIFLLAGGLSFSLFVCTIPMALIVFAVIGAVIEAPSVSDGLVEEVNNFVDKMVPYDEYATFIKELVFRRISAYIEEFRKYKNLAGWAGLVGLFIASSSLFSSMRTILNTVYRVKATGPVFMGKVKDFGLVLLVLVYFLLSTTILPALEVFQEFAQKLGSLSGFTAGFLEDTLLAVMSFLIIYLAFLIMYVLVPQRRLPKRVSIVSAFWAALLWELAKQLFGLYIANVATLSRVYGAYALLVVVAFWIYYTSIVFIVGAEIGQLSWERTNRRRLPEPQRSSR